MLPRRDGCLLDLGVLDGWICEATPNRELMLAVQEVRLIIEPATDAIAAAHATGKDRKRIHATLAKLCRRKAVAGRRDGWPGGSCSLRKK